MIGFTHFRNFCGIIVIGLPVSNIAVNSFSLIWTLKSMTFPSFGSTSFTLAKFRHPFNIPSEGTLNTSLVLVQFSVLRHSSEYTSEDDVDENVSEVRPRSLSSESLESFSSTIEKFVNFLSILLSSLSFFSK